jgi:alkanesulfonate monooxygenase SsuD/methylene tetrahydromethanopterin reductase-like flavin-dependent oxidoreductase (luciferase family)
MTKVILQVYPTVGDTTEMARRRPIGRDSDAYQAMLASLVELVQAADTLGYWGITHVEHHAHSEGLEISPDPLLLNVYLGHFTKRLMHGQLGIVVPTHDPVRLAAQIAIADHMLKGRLFVGMARGYQARWTNVVGQRFGVTSTASDKSAADQRNRLLFDEHYAVLKKAWENDLLRYKGAVYEVPYPFDEGIPNWPPTATTTAKYGVPGEVDEHGTVRGISVVPKPYTKPHPQLFQAFGASPRTLEWSGQENVTPTILAGPMEMVHKLAEAYREGARSRGRNPRLGEGVGSCRTIHFTRNKDDIYDIVDKYEAPVWTGCRRAPC